MTHSQICPDSLLEEIHRHHGAASDLVVRWCPGCGAVTVDEDFNGKVFPGAYKEMRFPKLVGKTLAFGLLNNVIPMETLGDRDKDIILRDLMRRRNAEKKSENTDSKPTEIA